ncbi:hypothetical protein [uncultured Eubacterium sp.]|jgi:hypothetical protein|uniref:hypothetical protein n=1 Tax=Eubacterium sp. TaxID=142586 RepID=UPI0032655EA1
MADTKSKDVPVVKHSKDQLIKSNKYRQYIDFLNAVLDDSVSYTQQEVDEKIEDYYGRRQ